MSETTPRATNRVEDKDGNIWYELQDGTLRRVLSDGTTIEYKLNGNQAQTRQSTSAIENSVEWQNIETSQYDAFKSQFNAAVYQVPVGAQEGSHRGGTVDFSDGSVIIPINNERFGKYNLPDDPTSNNLIYAEYDVNGEVIPGTAKVYNQNHEEYVNILNAAEYANPGAAKRGNIERGGDGTLHSQQPIPNEFDPFRPYKGNMLILSEDVQIGSMDGEDVKGIPITDNVRVYLNPTQDLANEVVSDLNDSEKQTIKQVLGMDPDETLTPADWLRYAQEFSTGRFTKVRSDNNSVSTFQYVNSLQGSTKNRAVSKEMRFNIVTGRGSYLQNSDSYIGQDFVVTDRTPLDYIHYLAQQEPWPTVVWQDPRTGEFWYVPRGLDISGLSDPLRFNRTYFFRQYPKDLAEINNGSEAKEVAFPRNNPHMATMLHSFREEESVISVRTNILVQSHAPKALTDNQGNYLLISVVPPMWRSNGGRAFAASFFTVTDNTATQNPGALIATALAYARTVGKELKSGACTMLGDPSIIPGEAIQIIGSPSHQDYANNVENINEDRSKFFKMAQDYESFYTALPKTIQEYVPGSPLVIDESNKFVTNSQDNDFTAVVSPVERSADRTMVEAAENLQSTGVNTAKFKSEPPTMWRVEAVIDKFNDGVDGYYTEVSLMSCF